MTDFGLEFQKRHFEKIEKYYNHLQDGERNRLIYLKNKAEGGKKLDAKDYNQLKDLADSVRIVARK